MPTSVPEDRAEAGSVAVSDERLYAHDVRTSVARIPGRAPVRLGWPGGNDRVPSCALAASLVGLVAYTPGPPPGAGPATNRRSCDGRHIRFSNTRLSFAGGGQKEDAMVADWIVIYAVLFILGAAVVGRVPAAA